MDSYFQRVASTDGVISNLMMIGRGGTIFPSLPDVTAFGNPGASRLSEWLRGACVGAGMDWKGSFGPQKAKNATEVGLAALGRNS